MKNIFRPFISGLQSQLLCQQLYYSLYSILQSRNPYKHRIPFYQGPDGASKSNGSVVCQSPYSVGHTFPHRRFKRIARVVIYYRYRSFLNSFSNEDNQTSRPLTTTQCLNLRYSFIFRPMIIRPNAIPHYKHVAFLYSMIPCPRILDTPQKNIVKNAL